MSKRISEMPLLEVPSGNEYVPVVHEDSNYILKLSDIGSTLNKAQIGLGNVDNTADIDKPVSNATRTAINTKADINHNHIIGQIDGLQTILNNKSPVGHKHVIADIDNLTSALQSKAELSNGKIPLNLLPDEVFDKLIYKGRWDFNVKLLPAADATNKGWYFIASNHVRSTTTPSFIEGDWAVSDGTTWDKIDNSDRVLTVSGRSGDVTLTTKDLPDFDSLVTDPLALKAPIQSPIFTGYPKTPTAVDDDISKTIANTEFVSSAISKATGALTKYDVGLGNVNNTSDVNKPISIMTQNALDTKADKIHTHAISDVLDLQTALDNKANKVHTHVIADVTGLQTSLDSKLDKSAHDSDLSNMNAMFNQKADKTQIVAIETALDDKANSIHTHVISDVTGLQTSLDNKADLSGDTFTGQVLVPSLLEKALAVPVSNVIDLWAATYWTKTITANTTFTISNAPTSGFGGVIILTLTNGGSATVGWWAGIKWAKGTTPALTSAGKDVLGFFTTDNGVTWSGVVLSKDSK